MLRTLLAIALSCAVSLSYAADPALTVDEARAAESVSAPVRTAVKKVKKTKTAKPKPAADKAAAGKTSADKTATPDAAKTDKAVFELSSPDIQANGTIPQRFEFDDFGCTGENRSPELHWAGAPADTKSFAITVYDPDAPTGSGWWHWMVYDLPADADQLEAGVGTLNSGNLPGNAAQGLSDFGVAAWGGTCPPKGDKPHRYVFTVHALKVEQLEVPANATPAMLGYLIHANALASTSFTAKYGRK